MRGKTLTAERVLLQISFGVSIEISTFFVKLKFKKMLAFIKHMDGVVTIRRFRAKVFNEDEIYIKMLEMIPNK